MRFALSPLFIGVKIRKLRKQLGKTQNDFAKDISVTQANISMIESGEIQPSSKVIQKIKMAYSDINLEWLIANAEEPLIARKQIIDITQRHQVSLKIESLENQLKMLQEHNEMLRKWVHIFTSKCFQTLR